jgi:hypothetical protein
VYGEELCGLATAAVFQQIVSLARPKPLIKIAA